MAVARDVLVELDVHEAVFFQRVHGARFGFARLQEAQRFRNRHLVDKHLAFGERLLGYAMAGLDHGRFACARRRGDARDLGEELADRHRVGRIVSTLVDNLQHVVGTDDRRRDLNAAGAPAIGHRHLARGERHLVAGDGDRFQDRPADHAFRLLVEIGEIVGSNHWSGHSAASSHSARMARTRCNSAWKST
jgi:hypothetical protein